MITSYIEHAIDDMHGKTIIFWGVGRKVHSFINDFCKIKKVLPMPTYITDSTRELTEQEIEGIPIISFKEIKKMDPDTTIIIITAGLLDLQSQVIQNELYYFPIYHFRSFEAFFYLKQDGLEKYEKVLGMLADDKSREIYKELFNSFINGCFWNQSLYERNPYINNDVISNLDDNDCIAFAGAFNGKHIQRFLNNNSRVNINAFEPNRHWYNYLLNKFEGKPNIKIFNKILWENKGTLGFHQDSFNEGRDAQVSLHYESSIDDEIECVDLDSFYTDRISFIVLDVEGSEKMALKGARRLIKDMKPKLAICLYHSIFDYIEIPLLIKELSNNSYKYYIKQHSCVAPIETVLYAV
jgi:FkbM family methyltransferase